MSIWGKVIGGTAGFMMGGPLGALLGAAAGHMYDKSKGAPQDPDSERVEGGGQGAFGAGFERAREQARQVAFTVAVVALGAKMAKADGQVSREEVDAFKRIFRIPPEEASKVGKLFDEAKKSADDFEVYARQVAGLFQGNPRVLEDLLDALFEIAMADGSLHPAEEHFLFRVAEIFGLPPRDWERVKAGHRARAGGMGPSDPYAVLGVDRNAADADVKAAYRKLLRENHPDLLMSQGMPEEFIEVANRKMADINAAWDEISRQRGMK